MSADQPRSLIVSDDPGVVEAVVIALSGFDVDITDDADNAALLLDAASLLEDGRPYDLVVISHQLSAGRSGIEVLSFAYLISGDSALVLLSPYDTPDIDDAAAGFNATVVRHDEIPRIAELAARLISSSITSSVPRPRGPYG